MNTLKVGTKVLLEYKQEYYERFFVGYNSKGLPVIEVDMNGTKGYSAVFFWVSSDKQTKEQGNQQGQDNDNLYNETLRN